MIQYNKVIVAGNLCADPENRETPKSQVTEIRLAVNSGWGDNKETAFVNVEAWGKTAEFAAKYLTKGRGIMVEGRLREDRWEDQEGGKRSRLKIVAERIQFADAKPDSGESQDKPKTENRPDDDLPF